MPVCAVRHGVPPLLLLLATLLPSADGLFNFGVDLFPDLKSKAPLGGGPVS